MFKEKIPVFRKKKSQEKNDEKYRSKR